MADRPIIKVIDGVRATRTLRAELMSLAADAASSPRHRVVLGLTDPRITEDRLEREWQAAARALRPDVLERMSLSALFSDGRSRVFGKPVTEALCKVAAEAPRSPNLVRLPQADSFFVVFKLLAYAWITGRGPVTTRWIMGAADCSYPTAAVALKRLGALVVRHPNRRVELRPLRREEWSRLLSRWDESRASMRFADRSGQPRPATALLVRLQGARPPGVAVGGVGGAKHYHPDLDLVGLPRLDLSVHCPGREVDISFVERLDPALKLAADAHEPAQLVVHFVRHGDPLFVARPDGLLIADPVECLLDLLESRLEPQALDFLRAMTSAGTAAR
jgi:hypothetical protein